MIFYAQSSKPISTHCLLIPNEMSVLTDALFEEKNKRKKAQTNNQHNNKNIKKQKTNKERERKRKSQQQETSKNPTRTWEKSTGFVSFLVLETFLFVCLFVCYAFCFKNLFSHLCCWAPFLLAGERPAVVTQSWLVRQDQSPEVGRLQPVWYCKLKIADAH